MAKDEDKEKAKVIADDQRMDWPSRGKDDLMKAYVMAEDDERGIVELEVLCDIRDLLVVLSQDLRALRSIASVSVRPGNVGMEPPEGPC